ncbi:Z1 domain-containing protein [Turicimonas muris]|uniref:Z1 domain-containing protein n=1 Tax=Turicimonas muris TaxID=1796652 RepID=UPI00249544DE|nr:Z1 domain-containing protein [Turicimonas muris]
MPVYCDDQAEQTMVEGLLLKLNRDVEQKVHESLKTSSFISLQEIKDILLANYRQTELAISRFGIQVKREEIERYTKELFNRLQGYSVKQSFITLDSGRSFGWVTEEMRQSRYYWKICSEVLSKELQPADVRRVDLQSEEILRHLHDPTLHSDDHSWSGCGLVVGNVQSGKTSNYSALLTKAVDAGYNIVVILTGMTNDLREQTQQRIDNYFCGYSWEKAESGLSQAQRRFTDAALCEDWDDDKAPICHTSLGDDFKNSIQLPRKEIPSIFVIKKNGTVLSNFAKWVSSQKADLSQYPLLMIDDEADQASINTAKDPDSSTAINKKIRKILALFPKNQFVAYTATPFANIFINADSEKELDKRDLFPRDFISLLSPSPNYFGPRDIFGDDLDSALDYFDLVPDSEAGPIFSAVREKNNPKALKKALEKAYSLRKAVAQFFLSSSIRLWREKRRNNKKELHSSMLVHLSHLTVTHFVLSDVVSDIVESFKNQIEVGIQDSAELYELFEGLLDEQKNTTKNDIKARESCSYVLDWELPTRIGDLLEDLESCVRGAEIKVVNQTTTDDIRSVSDSISAEQGEKSIRCTIFIGGNKLARGLTLPGLCCSYFLRGSQLSDTLLQMGRWFGHRDAYADLCRLWTTVELIEKFKRITWMKEDLEFQVQDMNTKNATPLDYALAIRQYPGVLITSPNKMRTAVEEEGRALQQIYEHLSFEIDKHLIERNLQITQGLIKQLSSRPLFADSSDPKTADKISADGIRHSGLLWKDIPAYLVTDFLEQFQAKTNELPSLKDRLIQYIQDAGEKGELTHWNVFLSGIPNEDSPLLVSPSLRSPSQEKRTADDKSYVIKSLKAGGHEYIGVPKRLYDEMNSRLGEEGRNKFRMLRKLAGENSGIPEQGFLLLYYFSSKELEEKLRKNKISAKGIVSYYLWMPNSANCKEYCTVLFNETVKRDIEEEK